MLKDLFNFNTKMISNSAVKVHFSNYFIPERSITKQ